MATNELEGAGLEVDGREQWRSEWRRTLATSSYPHVKAFEVVDRTKLAGTSTSTAT